MTAKTKTPAKTVDPYRVMLHHMQGWRIAEVRAALEAAGIKDYEQRWFVDLWEVTRPRMNGQSDVAGYDPEVRGIIAHAVCLSPYHENIHGKEYRHVFARAGKYIQRCVEEGEEVSVTAVKLWNALRWPLLPRKNGR